MGRYTRYPDSSYDPAVQAAIDYIVDLWLNRKPNWFKIWLQSIFSFGPWCGKCGGDLSEKETYSTNSPRSYCPICEPENG